MSKFVTIYIVILFSTLIISCYSDTHSKEKDDLLSELETECNANNILAYVDFLLAGSEFDAHYLYVGEQFSLSIWLVVPELDPEADTEPVDKNSDLAVLAGARLALSIYRDIPCVGDIFDVINPMIVDRNYNCWYRDFILIDNLRQDPDISNEKLLEIIKKNTTEMSYIRKNRVLRPEYSSMDSDCLWPQVSKSLQENSFPCAEHKNAAAYLLIFNAIAILELYWDVPGISKVDDEDIYKYIQNLKQDLGCLSPYIDRLEVYIVDAKGFLRVFASVQGSYLRRQEEKLFQEQIFLRRLP